MNNESRRLEELLAQQASRWIETLRDPGPRERAAFVAWLKESPRNVRDFLLMLTIEESLNNLDAKRMHDIEALLATVDRRVIELSGLSVRRRAGIAPRRLRATVALAASILVASLLGWMLLGRGDATWKAYETATGEQRSFELADGSVIHLNTHSRAAIRFSTHGRDVRLLEGEALFRVHHDASRPFRVYTDDAVIQAIGTQFDVYEQEENTVVAVIEGRVNITPKVAVRQSSSSVPAGTTGPANAAGSASEAAGRIVHSSEEAQINHAGGMSVRPAADIFDAVAWRERRLIFREQSLGLIAEQFNRYSRKQIRLEGPALAARVYTGVFDADDVESLAQALARDPQLSIESTDQSIVIRAR
jgi:transmembrane sensor